MFSNCVCVLELELLDLLFRSKETLERRKAESIWLEKYLKKKVELDLQESHIALQCLEKMIEDVFCFCFFATLTTLAQGNLS